MKTVNFDELDDSHISDLVETLDSGGLVCVPVNGSYRILADLEDSTAVMTLLQTKRRAGAAPSLVFIDDKKMLHKVVDDIDPAVKPLYNNFWPGPLTIRFDANDDLPRKVQKELVKANGRVGVRVPEDAYVRKIVSQLGRPVLVTSANRSNKPGESSRAQVRQNFGRGVAYFVDAGDLRDGKSSTIIEVKNGKVDIVRQGAIGADEITRLVG
ncbi:MAG: L-threonylcarbamoyladenylate synthase [Myxococcota bacterium]